MKLALVCIAKNEDHYIQEWVDYHTALGFDDIWIYQNEWRAEGVIGENVHLVEHDGKTAAHKPILERPQMKAYNLFIESNKGNYDWACFIDVDEFLVLKKHDSIKNFIQCYGEYDSIAVNWHIFGSNGHKEVSKGNYSVIDRFTKRGIGVNKHVKTMVKLSKNPVYRNPHYSNLKWVDTNLHVGRGPFNPDGPDDVAQINHYFCKTREEYVHKMSRGRAASHQPRDAEPDYLRHNLNEVEDLWAVAFLLC